MVFSLPIQSRIKTSVVNRIMAKLIDLGLAFVIGGILPRPIGPFLGFLYSILADGMTFWKFNGQSAGKYVMKLKVVDRVSRRPVSYRNSVLRNAPVGVATFFAIIPVWGWLILALVGLPLMVMEIYLMMSVETGHRLGDVMGDSEVVEATQ